MNKIEVLSPAGDVERLKVAVDFGADAVYLAGKEFGMRAAPSNFDEQDLSEAVKYAHENGVKVYVTCNTLPRNDEIERLPNFIKAVKDLGVDAFIAADIGVISLIKKYAPEIDLHVSTQAGVVNYVTAQEFYNMGASRVVLARELTLDDISAIRAKVNKKLELEAFVHGSMCVSFSGRCLLSSYLTGRDSNRGDCAQPCRWKYNLVEENRNGQFFPIIEENAGTYILNSKDLCMIEHIPELVDSGINSLKIEGTAKSEYYVAVTTNAYKLAVNQYLKGKAEYVLPDFIKAELDKISHREYSTGFFFGDEPGQTYSNGGYIRNYDVVAICNGWKDGVLEVSQRNKFSLGDVIDILEPGEKPFIMTIDNLFDEWGNSVESAPHPMQRLFIKTDKKVKRGAFLRRKR